MKKALSTLAVSLVLTLGLCGAALAAEDADIQVQLDGQPLTFTDAAPQVKDNRTFLPYRAVFEAMGATVGNEGNLITATRGDTTLTMTIGELTATLTTGDKSTPLTMDVAPFVDNTNWRTYVPVRFAADAFGCNVGWDQQTKTAILVDVEKLADGILEGEEYSLLGKFADYSNRFNQGNFSCEGTLAGSATMMGSPAMTLDGTVNGLTADGTTADLTMKMNLDMTQMYTMLAAMQNSTPEKMGVTPEQLKLAMDMNMKMDMNAGTYYINYGDQLTTQMGLPAGAWITMDMGSMLAQSGLDLEALKQMDFSALVEATLASYNLDGKSATGYKELQGALATLSATLSDKGFKKTETGYETTFTANQDGVSITLVLALTTNSKQEVVGYTMTADANIAMPKDLMESMAKQGLSGADSLTLSMDTAVDAKNRSTAAVGIRLGEMLTMDVSMDATLTKTDKVPNVALPEGAVAVDLATLMAGAAAQQTPDEA